LLIEEEKMKFIDCEKIMENKTKDLENNLNCTLEELQNMSGMLKENIEEKESYRRKLEEN